MTDLATEMTDVVPVIGVAGPRRLTVVERGQAWKELHILTDSRPRLHVGCAGGLDSLAAGLIYKCASVEHHVAQSRERWQLQARTKALVAALASESGTLHAWPNVPCPMGLTRQSWQGSGTWGAIREAVARRVPVVLHPLGDLGALPIWLLD